MYNKELSLDRYDNWLFTGILLVAFYINLRTKCVFLVMFRPPLPPCTHLYALVLTPPPPLGAYVINGRPLTECSKAVFSSKKCYGFVTET